MLILINVTSIDTITPFSGFHFSSLIEIMTDNNAIFCKFTASCDPLSGCFCFHKDMSFFSYSLNLF